MSRAREMMFRVGNGMLLRALGALHRQFGVGTVYEIGRGRIAALFEGQRFVYSPRDFGCTGNLDWVGDAENETREALFAELSPGDVFYDIGAHGGVYSLTYLAHCEGGEVHSFEPMPEELIENFRLNGHDTGHVHALAAGDSNGTVRMTTRQRSSNHVDAGGERAVPMVRIDDYAAERGLPDPQWIKIDIEGMELPALRGAEKLLRRAQPVVICEINELFNRFGTTLPAFFDTMASFGYGLWRLQDQRLRPVARSDSLAALGFSANDNYWWVPQGRALNAMR